MLRTARKYDATERCLYLGVDRYSFRSLAAHMRGLESQILEKLKRRRKSIWKLCNSIFPRNVQKTLHCIIIFLPLLVM
ncbi:hypothetical protein OESDEN_08193 [Oesophagostomum dentatum]|uniref:Uncharacterized protein n=1 Tax=Oesophagostomum dentatum TaxID=61180 RepID=A0A0B1T2X8_OESDE|nr:hypothetical protein OESDEN_08193 [Oesophagostomum dentatum]